MSFTRRMAAAALVALAIDLTPASAQTRADSAAAPKINTQIAGSPSVTDTLRIPAVNTRRAWAMDERGRRAARGAFAGGTIGGLLGIVVGGALLSGFCDAADCSDAARDGAIAGAGLGALTGAAIGGLIGFVW